LEKLPLHPNYYSIEEKSFKTYMFLNAGWHMPVIMSVRPVQTKLARP
jgi:hypothetical protein